jgi:hypothetical protein
MTNEALKPRPFCGGEAMSGIVERLGELRNFLNGEGPLDGHHFGDMREYSGRFIPRFARFWWRAEMQRRIDEAAAHIAALEAREAEWREAAERCAVIVDRYLYHQHEKVEDVPRILRALLERTNNEQGNHHEKD